MAENKLKPCPFCGSDEVEVEHNAHGEFWCYCPACYSRTGTYDQENGYTLAIEAWNRRADNDREWNM